ncbi:MAG: hypothetical protein WB800_25485 [Streptosporangiaceae bacterium]|jgi:hypothetical protein
MYPHQMEQMVSQHTDELRAQAHLARRHVQRPGPRNSVRHRAGWTLVEIGLRLAGGSDDA